MTGTLPCPLTSFVGRQQELGEIGAALTRHRLVTLTGRGGCGKSRLAIETARRRARRFPDGIWFVDLAGVGDGQHVAPAVVAALGLRLGSPSRTGPALAETLRGRRMLLLLDTCELVADACAELASSLLLACPDLRVLATSQRALGVPGEALFGVPPLSLLDRGPGSVSDATLLFEERARLRDAAFGRTPANTQSIGALCQRLRGLALAIELAAAWVPVLSVTEIAERVGAFDSLAERSEGQGPPRHRTVRATLDRSYELLTQPEQALFERLSIFVGGFSFEAAEAVGGTDDTLGALSQLVAKSFVSARSEGDSVRHELLDTLREYGQGRLRAGGALEDARRGHALYFAALATEAGPELRGPRTAHWFACFDRERDNIRQALSWSLQIPSDEPGSVNGALDETGDTALRAETGLTIGGVVWWFWWSRGNLEEGSRWLQQLLALPAAATSPHRAQVLDAAALMAREQGDYAQALALYQAAQDLNRASDNQPRLAWTLLGLGALDLSCLGRFERARAELDEALALHLAMGVHALASNAASLLGWLTSRLGPAGDAWASHAAALALAEQAGDQTSLGFARSMRADSAMYDGDVEKARGEARQALHAYYTCLGDKRSTVEELELLAGAAAQAGEMERALRLIGATEQLREISGVRPLPIFKRYYDEWLAPALNALTAPDREALIQEGRVMTWDQAVAYALSTGEGVPLAVPGEQSSMSDLGPPPPVLTRREAETLSLIGRGKSNKEIAADLVVTVSTAERHVANVFRKIGVRSRAAAAAWAITISSQAQARPAHR